MALKCTHLDQIRDVQPRTPEGCEECLRTGGKWIELRLCLTCGHVGCCDKSLGRHATLHFQETHHPIIRSLEAGHKWGWCFVEKTFLRPVPAGAPPAR